MRPTAFALGCALLVAGVLLHLPMLAMGRNTGWRMVGMPMDAGMVAGMALICGGLGLAFFGLLRPSAAKAVAVAASVAADRAAAQHATAAQDGRLRSSDWRLWLVLTVTVAVDVMKPATLGFVMPGMAAEYGIDRATAGLLALSALTGTTVGSVLWGRLADRHGRRASILLSALMFIGTSVCGAMPSFGWNLAMCFLMGASAGGLLPIAFTLLAETVPARHRGWMLVALGGVGTTLGYLLASGCAALLEPVFGWRVLWLLGLPTGALIILLHRQIPESPQFAPPQPRVPSADPSAGPPLGRLTVALLVCGTGWGLVNFGFLLWLPGNLGRMGIAPQQASQLLAQSALYALPGVALTTWLYHAWSSVKSLVLLMAFTVATLLVFALLAVLGWRAPLAVGAATIALLASLGGVIAMLIPYAAEVYPLALRGTGSGLVAAGSKAGGLLAAGLAAGGFFEGFLLSTLLVAAPLAAGALLLAARGPETRGRALQGAR